MADEDDLHGFEAPERTLEVPPVPVSDQVRDAMVNVLAAVVCGATPEEVSEYLQTGFPDRVTDLLAREHELDEMRAHVDLLLCVQQMPALTPTG